MHPPNAPEVITYDLHTAQPYVIQDALNFAGSASRKDCDKVGWIPLQAYREATLQKRLVICENNGDKVGFLMWAPSRGELKIYQIWIRQDARLILHGLELVQHVQDIASRDALYRLRAWVAEDLAANIFWSAIGFECIAWRHTPRKTAKRKHLLWTRAVMTPHAATLYGSTVQPSAEQLTPKRPGYLPLNR